MSMIKILRVGDPHVKPSNLVESESLMNFVLTTAHGLKADRIEILGDLFDTHEIVRLSVLKFWQKWFSTFAIQAFKTVILVGNHDQTGDYVDTYSALHPFLDLQNDNFSIITDPLVIGNIGYLPYIHDNKRFVEEANELAELGAKVLVSHPNYKGAVYDNGSPILDGVDPSDLDARFRHLIGGHIHTELEIGRVWYTGNARWLTKSCANKRKGIWLCDHDDLTGEIVSKQFISTESVCTPIVSLIWKEGDSRPEIVPGCKTNIELYGSSDWVTKAKKDLLGSVSVSSKITDTKKSRERKSGRSLHEFLSKHYETDKREKLIKYMGGLDLV